MLFFQSRTLANTLLAAAVLAASVAASAQSGIGRPVYTEEQMQLDWPIAPEHEKYKSIAVPQLKRTVEQLAAFSREYRDTVNPQAWGRIIGNSAHDKSSAWLASEFRAMGITDVREQRLALPTQTWPERWSAALTSGDERFVLASAIVPSHGDRQRLAPFDLTRIAVEYVGFGAPADFRGRDLRGKAVMIYSQPQPGLFSHTARRNGAIERAEAAGARAVILTVGLPGNISGQALIPSGQLPVFVVGQEDFTKGREMLEKGTLTLDAKLETRTLDNAKTTLVMAVLPGTTDETIFVSAHVDGYYEAAYDNGGGVAALMELARHYARIPRAQRRRTIYFVANPGHHEPHRVGSQWILKNMPTELSKAAVIINLEHLAYVQALMFPTAMQKFSSASAAMAWYAGGSDAFRKLAIDSLRSFGVGAYLRPNREIKDNPARTESGYGIVTYGAPPSDIMDLAHLAPFFQAISADWPYHTTEDKVGVVHWPALANVTRAHALLIDGVNEMDLADIQADGHPLALP